jgi:hypothetical protein
MIRTLFIIAGAALVLCLASIGGAMALGSRDLAAHDWTWVISDDEAGPSERVNISRGDLGPDSTRTLDWSGGQQLTVDLSADVTYVQGDKPGVVVTGPKQSVERVRLVGGRLSLADGDDDYAERVFIRWGPNGIQGWSESERLKITVTAPSVNSFRVAGSGDLTIENYDQPTLSLIIDGSGDVHGVGRAGRLTLRTNGSGDVELDDLEVTDAEIDSTGSGEVVVGPTGDANIRLSGSGDVDLTRRPKSLQTDVSGSGEVSGT